MLTGDGTFAQCYNAQAVVDADNQASSPPTVTDCASDVVSLIPMAKQVAANTGASCGRMSLSRSP